MIFFPIQQPRLEIVHDQKVAEEEIIRLGVDKNKSVAIRARIARELFAEETEDVKGLVMSKLEEEKARLKQLEESGAVDAVRTPEQYQR